MKKVPAFVFFGIAFLIIFAVLCHGPSRAREALPSQSSDDDMERSLSESMIQWAMLQDKLGNDAAITDSEKETISDEAKRLSFKARDLLLKLKPEFISPQPVHQSEVERYVLDVVERYQPDKLEILRDEFNLQNKARTASLLKAVALGLEQYRLDYGFYPESGILSVVKALADNEDYAYLRLDPVFFDQERRIIDFWGNALVYKRPDPYEFSLYSPGPDGKDDSGGGDDITFSGE